MLPLTAVATLAAAQGLATGPRFVSAKPLPSIAPITIDSFMTGGGVANSYARREGLQGRMLWIDCTANIDRYDSDAKLATLTQQIADAGFNTLVLDVKPISGQVIYRSEFSPQLEEWKGKRRDTSYDVLAGMLRHARPKGLSVLVSLNAFSEGHRLFKVGPGYDKPEWQTTIYDTENFLAIGEARFSLATTLNKAETDRLAVYTASSRVPSGPNVFAITLRPDGTIVDGFAFGGVGEKVPTMPTGGVVVSGTGPGAEFLRAHATPGQKVTFESQPNFVKMAPWSGAQYPLMMNPNHPGLRKFELDVLADVVSRYPVDGVLYDDRLRYAGMFADFSEETRAAFEKEVGAELQWPDDVFRYTLNGDLSQGLRPGRYYDQWMAWRASVLRDFVQDARQIVKKARPSAAFGAYVGSWYGEYPALGHNYADPAVEVPLWFYTSNYRASGSAPLFDLLVPGCYYPTATIYDAMSKGAEIGRTVEASSNLADSVVNGQAWSYAGIALSQFKDNPKGLQNALQAAVASSQGVMVFDLSHDIDPMWPVFREAFVGAPKTPPHARLDVLARVRKAAKTSKGQVKITSGASGTGH